MEYINRNDWIDSNKDSNGILDISAYLEMMKFINPNNPPAFSLYAQDFLSGCIYLEKQEIGMYIQMICKQWTDFLIPKERLSFLIGCKWDDLSKTFKEKFTDYGDFVVNERLEKERTKKADFINKQRINGKKGGRPPKDGKPKLNPNDNQKKPLEDRNRKKEKEIEIENTLPFKSEKFKNYWDEWINYRMQQHNFQYQSQSEKAALDSLTELSNSENGAIKIILHSISNGWKGFYEINSSRTETKIKIKSNRNRPLENATVKN